MAEIFNSGQFQAIGNDGKVVPYGKLYFYDAGTTNPRLSYTTSLKNATNTIPVILSASGKADVFLDVDIYDVVLKDQYDVVVWTIENYEIYTQITDATLAETIAAINVANFNEANINTVASLETELININNNMTQILLADDYANASELSAINSNLSAIDAALSKDAAAVSESNAAITLNSLISYSVEVSLTNGNLYDLGFVSDTLNTGLPTDLGGLI